MFAQRQEGVLTDLRQLKTLSVIHNFISSIELRVFDESANLSSLSSIDVSYNSLTELEPWPMIRAQHRPMFVGLQSNRITNFTNELQWSFDCNSTRVFKTTMGLDSNDIRHIVDIVHGWNIDGRLSHHAITSAKKVMFSPVSVCLSVNRITEKLLIKSL